MGGYPYFDWLRIALASLVFWEHASIFPTGNLGNFAVQVFFALSGWLIGGILLKTTPSALPRFFYYRVMRIWIPYMGAVALLYVVAFGKEGIAPLYFKTLTYDLTFTHNWFIEKTPDVIQAMPLQGTGSHFWSIAVEEQFYLLAPLLLVLSPIRRSVLAWAGLTLVSIAVGGWYSSILAGVLAVMVNRAHGDWHLDARATAALLAMLVAVTLANMLGWLAYHHVAPLAAIAIVLLLARPGQRTAFGIFAGGISYPMYLHHWTGLFAGDVVALLMPGLGLVLSKSLGFAFALTVASVAYILLDRQVLAYRDRIYSPRLGWAATSAAYILLFIGVAMAGIGIGPLNQTTLGS